MSDRGGFLVLSQIVAYKKKREKEEKTEGDEWLSTVINASQMTTDISLLYLFLSMNNVTVLYVQYG